MSETTHDSMGAPGESASVASQKPVPKKRNHRRAHKAYDARFIVGRRTKELTLIFRERLNVGADPDPIQLSAIERAAQLQALAEQASARALRADPRIGLDDLVRLQRLADLAVRRLRLDQRSAKQPSLANVLRSQGAAP